MAEVDLQAGLRSLRDSLRQIKSLLAWEHLKQAEVKPSHPTAFQISDPIQADLRNEYSFFLSTSLQMHSILNDSSFAVSEADRQNIKRQLAKIEQQVYSLNLHQRFCTC
jgi:hypothetical protein